VNKSGSLAGVKRHDYLPFGEELSAGTGCRTTLSDTQYVTNLYEAFLQRGPDAGGLGYWSGQASVGTGRQNVLNAFAVCSAFRELSGTLRALRLLIRRRGIT